MAIASDIRKVPHTLLLADDSVTIQRVIELTFADEDITVVAVSDGDQAIERLEASPPDIVLADIGMPGKNGYEVAQYIRQTPKLSHIPVVLLTGAFEPVDQARAAEAGCDGVLAKPLEPQLVIGRVKELLARPRQAAVVASSDFPATELARAPEKTQPAEPVDYFDRLDRAFAELSTAPKVAPKPTAPAPDLDWLNVAAQPSAATNDDLPLAYTAGSIDFDKYSAPGGDAPRVAVIEESAVTAEETIVWTPHPVAAPAPSVPVLVASAPPMAHVGVVPPIAEAFAALLAAEQ